MIYSIRGKISQIENDFIVLETESLSYQIFTTHFLLEKIKIGEEIKIFTHLEVKENSLELYGFETEEEIKIFKLLLSISGIGPKSGLNILSLIRLQDLKKAIINEKTDALIKISGIGEKTAKRIILELKGKITKNLSKTNLENDSLIIDALTNMGYSLSQSREAIKKIPPEIEGTEKRIKQALKILSGK